MRKLLILLVLLQILPFSALSAPSAESWILLGPDPSGDVRAGGSAALENPVLDLISLEATESDGNFWVRLGLVGLNDGPVGPGLGAAEYVLRFDIGGSSYRIVTDRIVPLAGPNATYQSAIQGLDELTGQFEALNISLRFEADEAASQLLWNVAWQDIPGKDGLRVLPGDVVTGIHASSRSGTEKTAVSPTTALGGNAQAALVGDRLPDLDVLDYVVQTIGQPGAEILATSQHPLRASNGAGATFLFPIEISNLKEDDVLVELEARDLPPGWSAAPLANPIAVAAGTTVTSSIVVATTFRHEHGAFDVFSVHVMEKGASVASVTYEVHYTDTPQPSGHHPTLYCFTVIPPSTLPEAVTQANTLATGYHSNAVYMSTLSENDHDDHVQVTASTIGTRQGWEIALSPALTMGLDFAPEGGQLTLSIATSRDLTLENVGLEVELVVEQEADVLVLMNGLLDVGTLAAESTFNVPLAVLPEIDVIPYELNQKMLLRVYVDYTDATGTGVTPNLLPGGILQLPLEEYQDVIPQGTLSPLKLVATERTRYINPGERTTLDLEVTGPAGSAVSFDALGLPDGWKIVFSPRNVKLNEQAEPIRVQVTAPAQAEEGDVAAFFVRATTNGGNAPTAIGFRIIVDAISDLPDEVPLQSTGGKSASLGPISSVAIVVALCLACRRVRLGD